MDTSYLASQVSTIVAQLHGLFDEIGVASHDRESREAELFSALSETLHNHVRIVAAEKNDLAEEGHRIITNIKLMEGSLDDNKSRLTYEPEDEDMRVSYPLLKCLKILKEKHLQISRVHHERLEQVKKLVQALESYSSHLEASFVQIVLPPTAPNASVPPSFDLSSNYITSLDKEFTRVYEEYTRRVTTVKTLSENIIQLWAELGTPQAQTDATIVKHHRDSPEQLGLHEDDLFRLRNRHDKLMEEKKARERRLKELKTAVEALWNRLGIEEHDRKQFSNSNRGCGIRQINEFEDELTRLHELKRQNLHLFVEDARYRLQELWDGLYFSEEEMLEFTPAFSDVYSDALLSAHEQEIGRLEALKEQRAPTLMLIDEHRSLVKDRDDLAAASQDASRLMMRGQKGEKRDPTRLLREEKMRKRIAKDLPKIAVKLRKVLEDWEDEYGRPFLVHGERYIDELDASEAKPPPGPRSKTPAGPVPVAAKTQKAASVNRGNSAIRAPPPRSKTPGCDTLRRNPLPASISAAAGRTPSRIPARAPLSSLQHGNNSPERRGRFDGTDTIRKMAPPLRAPPPKMRDVFIQPAVETPVQTSRSVSVESGASVRPVALEDVYDERQYAPRTQHHFASVRQDEVEVNRSNYQVNPNSSRQISGNSAATTNISGSENWETYDDVSELEDNVGTYYPNLRESQNKRSNPHEIYSLHNAHIKKQRGMLAGNYGDRATHEPDNVRIASNSETNWTDEDAF